MFFVNQIKKSYFFPELTIKSLELSVLDKKIPKCKELFRNN